MARATVKTRAPAKAAKKKLSAPAYVSRPSQATKKKPTKRLTNRRAENLKAPKGVFPNPIENGFRTFTVKKWKRLANTVSGNPVFGFELESGGHVVKGKTKPNAAFVYSLGQIYVGDKIHAQLSQTPSGRVYMTDAAMNNPSTVHFDIDVGSHNAKGSRAKTKTNPVKKGVTSRPSKASRRAVYLVESSKAKNGPWESQGIFPSEEKARNYAEALHLSHAGYWFRVVLK